MTRSIFRFLSLILLLVSCTSANSSGDDAKSNENKVILTVGSQCITELDIESRLMFIALMSGIEITSANKQSLKKDAVKMLYQEQLQLHEMMNNGLNIQDDPINLQLAEMAQRVGVAPENLENYFEQKDITFDTVRQFVTVQYYWPQYIRFKYPSILEVSEDRINSMYAEQQKQKDKNRYLVAEIFIPVNTPAEESTSKQQIDMVYEELKKGTQFPMLAQQFSQAPSARQGGNMGWITLDFLPDIAKQAIEKLEKGQATEQLRQEDGYAIYALIEKKTPGDESQDTVFSLRQIIMNIDQLQEQALTAELKKCKTCEELDEKLSEHPYIQVEKSNHVAAQQLNPQLAGMVQKLGDNELSEPLRYPQGAMYMWVCSRHTVDGTMSKDEIRYRFVMQNLAQKSRSVLSRVARTTFVEFHDDTYHVQL